MESRIEQMVDGVFGASPNKPLEEELDCAISAYDELARALEQIKLKGLHKFWQQKEKESFFNDIDNRSGRARSPLRRDLAQSNLRPAQSGEAPHQVPNCGADPAPLRTIGSGAARTDLLLPAGAERRF